MRPFRLTAAGFSTALVFLTRAGFCPVTEQSGNVLESSQPGNINGFASLQCVPGGIGRTIRSSRIDPPAVFDGNHQGVVVSPARIR